MSKMNNFMSTLVFMLLVLGGICQSQTTNPPTEPTTISQSPVDTTTGTTKADTTTVSTTPVPTTSTLAPTTPTSAPTTSSPKPTTTPPVPTTQPSTTPSDLPPTTVSPTTVSPPVPDTTFWNVTEGNITCIRAELRIRFKIQVKDQVDYIILTQDADSGRSSCNATNGTQELSLVGQEYEIMMVFEKDSSSSPKVYMKEVTFSYNLPGNIQGVVSNNSHLFEVNAGNSYLCNTGDVDLENVTMEVMHIRIQAFQGEGNKDFGTVEECEADNKVNDLIPIIVGCCLLALVVIVLIAYFVGRRRNRQKGYQSV